MTIVLRIILYFRHSDNNEKRVYILNVNKMSV